MNPMLLQKQLKENALNLQEYCQDLKNWGEEMKRKEDSLKNSNSSSEKKVRKVDNKKKSKTRTGVTDYSKWDKFDADAACEELDDDISEDSELTDEHDESLRDQALVHKEKGNKFVKEEKWSQAIGCYTEAIKCYRYDPIFYANRALCYLRRGDMAEAEEDCTTSIKLDSTYVKAYQRRAAARESQNKLIDAKFDLLKVLQLEPHNKESKKALEILKTKLGEHVELQSQRPVSKFTASRSKSTETFTTPTNVPKPKIIDVEKNSPFPKRDDIVLIKAINKPPHMRSKKPLKRIVIKEADLVSMKKSQSESIITAVKENVIERQEPKIETKKVSEFKKSREKALNPSKPKEENLISKEIKNTCNLNKINQENGLTPPKSSAEFHEVWKSLSSPEEQYKFLSLIPVNKLGLIFDKDIESGVFKQILTVIEKFYIEEGKPIFDILWKLSMYQNCKGIEYLDQNRWLKLLDYIESSEGKSKEDIEDLKICYKLNIN